MKTAYGILIGVVATIFGLVGLVAFLQIKSHSFHKEHEEFVRDFAVQFSETWEIKSFEQLLSNDLLIQMDTPNGREAIRYFGQLGRIEDISDLEFPGYTSGTDGDTGTFRFKAQFEYGSGVVTITVTDRGEGPRIHGFHINVTSQTPYEEREKKA